MHGKSQKEVLYTGNSGTTTRLMLGILAGTNLHTVMTGDASIGKRPMRRVADPLRQMGAQIAGRDEGQFTPLAIQGTIYKNRLHNASCECTSKISYSISGSSCKRNNDCP